MITHQKPYIIVPKLIEQPTWGGDFITIIKGWQDLKLLSNKKIGQSYELFSQSKLLVNVKNNEDVNFTPELGEADSEKVFNETGYKKNIDYLNLNQVTNLTEEIPLIKINQSNGNSFQLHVKSEVKNDRWLSKPESWYYLKDGLVTLGIKKNCDLRLYKNSCREIEKLMQQLSGQIKNKKTTLIDARKKAAEFIKKINPWQFVNTIQVEKYSVVDPSAGGIHHSWEEDSIQYPDGNVLYEVQKDVMDPVSTLRCFDKGKFKNDGSIREIHIDDYFKYLDKTPENNDPKKLITKKNDENLIRSDNYRVDGLEIKDNKTINPNGSFSHLFVRDGKVKVTAAEGEVILSQGHSCFIPEIVSSFIISNLSEKSFILRAYVNN